MVAKHEKNEENEFQEFGFLETNKASNLIQWSSGMTSEESRGHVIFMIYFHMLYLCSSSNLCVIIIILISNYHLNDYFSIFLYI